MPKVPFDVEGEYRGQKPSGEFEREGSTIAYTEGLQLEVEQPDGSVDTWTLRRGKLDQVADFDVSRLTKGDRVRLVGSATVADGDDGRSFVSVHSCKLAEGAKLGVIKPAIPA